MGNDYRKRKFFDAVLNGRHGEVARYISRGRANPAWKVGSGMSALDQAAYLGHVRIAELLLDNGWDLEARNDLGGRPLHCCATARNCHVHMIQFLVGRGAMLDCQDNLKDTPLHLAADEVSCSAWGLTEPSRTRLGRQRRILPRMKIPGPHIRSRHATGSS